MHGFITLSDAMSYDKLAYSHIRSIFSDDVIKVDNQTQMLQAYFFVTDQSHKQAFKKQYWSETLFHIKLTDQSYI